MLDIRKIVNEKLDEIEKREDVKVLYCIESGSRAWGFPSPDSDYDVRFIYVHKPEWYLDLNRGRDVIEWQLDDTLDINGWDLDKALKLLHSANPSLFEWKNSPIVYRTTPEWEGIAALFDKYFDTRTMMNNYLGLTRNTIKAYIEGRESVRLKKYFYVLRPLLAAKWVADKNCPPPMLFDELIDEYLPSDIRQLVDKLLEIKKVTSELGEGPRIPEVDKYVAVLLEELNDFVNKTPPKDNKSWDELNKVFRENLNY